MSESKHVTLLGKRKHENRPDEPSAKKHEARPDGFYDWRELLGGKIDEATRLPRVLVDIVCDYFPDLEYDSKGRLQSTSCFGKREGPMTGFVKDKLFMTMFFINGQAHGVARLYHDDGSIYVNMPYYYGRIHGTVTTYFTDLTHEVVYEYDKEVSRRDIRK